MIRKLMVAAVLTAACSGAAHAELVTNGGFETGDLTGWTLTTDWAYAVDGMQHSGVYGAVVTNTTNNVVASISQNLTTVKSQQYTISFWLANDTKDSANQFKALWNGVEQSISPLLNPTIASNYTQYTFTTTAASGTSTLAFNFINNGGVYSLDDVKATPTPIPAAAYLLGSGLLGLAGIRRKQE